MPTDKHHDLRATSQCLKCPNGCIKTLACQPVHRAELHIAAPSGLIAFLALYDICDRRGGRNAAKARRHWSCAPETKSRRGQQYQQQAPAIACQRHRLLFGLRATRTVLDHPSNISPAPATTPGAPCNRMTQPSVLCAQIAMQHQTGGLHSMWSYRRLVWPVVPRFVRASRRHHSLAAVRRGSQSRFELSKDRDNARNHGKIPLQRHANLDPRTRALSAMSWLDHAALPLFPVHRFV